MQDYIYNIILKIPSFPPVSWGVNDVRMEDHIMARGLGDGGPLYTVTLDLRPVAIEYFNQIPSTFWTPYGICVFEHFEIRQNKTTDGEGEGLYHYQSSVGYINAIQGNENNLYRISLQLHNFECCPHLKRGIGTEKHEYLFLDVR